jgi:hypothetical protein
MWIMWKWDKTVGKKGLEYVDNHVETVDCLKRLHED